MKDEAFKKLLASIREAGEIRRGQKSARRVRRIALPKTEDRKGK